MNDLGWLFNQLMARGSGAWTAMIWFSSNSGIRLAGALLRSLCGPDEFTYVKPLTVYVENLRA
jgi:hypothetical protein